MKRKKWFKHKNSETGHVVHSPILPEDMTCSEGDTYYELICRSRLSRKERKRLHVYRNRECVAKSRVDGIDMTFELFDAGGEYCDSIQLKRVR